MNKRAGWWRGHAKADVSAKRVVLIGNPNTGKTTLFNRLTGSRQRVGNYPGITVARKSGELRLGGVSVEVVDLPGAYSLAASSPDERIACDVLMGRSGETPALAVCTMEAAHLQRGLFLACQIADLGVPLILAVNFMDEAMARGMSFDLGLLSSRLGVPVVATSARSGHGVDDLRATIQAGLDEPRHMTLPSWSDAVHDATKFLAREIPSNHRLRESEIRRILFDHDSALFDVVGYPKAQRADLLARARTYLTDGHPLAHESAAHHKHLTSALDGVITCQRPPTQPSRVDRLLTHPVVGLIIFAVFMFLVFQAIYSLATPAMDAIEGGFGWLAEIFGAWLEPLPVFQSLVCDGILAGVGGVLVFLPQIFLLFFFVSLMEDTGYMARAAFLMDKLFGWCGLNGKSFVPLLSSYACAIPGLYATRTIEDPKARLLTILIAPLMSCSARLPVYLLMIGAFVAPVYGPTIAALTLFAFHILGLAVALPVAWIVNRWILKIPSHPFVLEMPPYRCPVPRDVLWRVWLGGRDFLQRAGGIILALSIIIWALLSFPKSEMTGSEPAVQIENSYLGLAGKAIQPLFAPAGYDWKLTIGVLASFPAREVIVSTLGIIYRLEGDEDLPSLAEAMRAEKWASGPRRGQPVFTVATALSLMVFFALCMQCASTLAVTAREVGFRYAVITFVYMTALAWMGAVLTFQGVTALWS
ncbi:MAG: ferrous iron transport protein B [Terrimicrobiaceae bacterium]